MDDYMKELVAEQGFGTVKTVLHTATIMYASWELDGEAWIVEMEDGRIVVLTTDHGRLCPWTRKDAEEKITEMQTSIATIRKALEIWPAE